MAGTWQSNIAGRKAKAIDCRNSPPALAAKAATATIPIVFSGGGDPVKLGLVASLSRPGGNATGVTNIATELIAKRLQLLRELAPTATVISVLVNPASPNADDQIEEVRAAARVVGQEIHFVRARSESEFDAAFADIVGRRAPQATVSPSSRSRAA